MSAQQSGGIRMQALKMALLTGLAVGIGSLSLYILLVGGGSDKLDKQEYANAAG